MTGPHLDEFDADEELGWTLSSAVLTAQASTIRALEAYLMLVHYGDAGPGDVQTYIDEAIQTHESILDDLYLARDAVNASAGAEHTSER